MRNITRALALPALAAVVLGAAGSGVAAATEPKVTCPQKRSSSKYLTVHNTLDVPITINSGAADFCKSFVGAGNPSSYNGRTIPAYSWITMNLKVDALAARWRMAFGAGTGQRIGAAWVECGFAITRLKRTTRAPAASGQSGARVLFHGPEGWVTTTGIGGVKSASGAVRDVKLVGKATGLQEVRHTIEVAYVR